MIVAITHTKGGVGKTSIAFPLAIVAAKAGRDVLLVDGDAQASSAKLAARRADFFESKGRPDPAQFSTVQITGKTLKDEVRKLGKRHEIIIIDVGGRDSDTLRSSLLAADIALIPVPPRTLDVWATLDDLAPLLADARSFNEKLNALAFISGADPVSTDNAEAIQILRDAEGITYLDAPIGRRKAVPNALSDGLAVFEVKHPDNKAVRELRVLAGEIFDTK